MVHFEDKGMFPKVRWRILEDSGWFVARIPKVVRVNVDLLDIDFVSYTVLALFIFLFNYK